MSFRAKLYVTGVSKSDGGDVAHVTMGAVYESLPDIQGNACEENKVFGQWTPNASFQATIYNPNVIERLQIGKQFYVDFTPAE